MSVEDVDEDLRDLRGIAGAPGFALGRVRVVGAHSVPAKHRHVPLHAVDDEMDRFDRATRDAAAGLRELAQGLAASPARAEVSILEAYVLMVEDATLRSEVERHVRLDRQCAEWATENAVNAFAAQLREGGDPYLRERSHDFEFVGQRIANELLGRRSASSLPAGGGPVILVARDLSPAETATFTKETVLAFVTEMGTRTSHTSILARALEIPAVVGVKDALERLGDGDEILVDGWRGHVTVSPNAEVIRAVRARADRHRAVAVVLREARDLPAQTRCGVPMRLRGNIELPSEAALVRSMGGQGIGLYRTEFLYVDRTEPPSEDEQYETYRRVLEEMGPHPVTLRTFDIGGDKFVSPFQAPNLMNPALGLRAVRLGLAHPDLFLAQLRAMVRASAHGDVQIMAPMVSTLRELRAVKSLLRQATAEVDERGQAHAPHVPFGVMVEVPSAAVMAPEIAREVEFLSIGTNDLVQYALAVDRGSRELAYLASPFDPAILRLIRGVVEAARNATRSVSVCGTMASDPLAAVLLVGMGLRELSMEASALGHVKSAVSRVSLEEAESIDREVSRLEDARDVERVLATVLAPRLADLLATE